MNEIAAEELLEHTEFVRRVARAVSADAHSAEDLVQETWVTALTRARPDATRLRSWLAGVARNLAREGRRGSTRRSARESAAARREGQPATDDLVARMETHRRVVSAVLELPESARQVIVLHYFDGLPPREIAARLGLPVETVRTRVKRARERLRETLVEAHGSRKACLLALAEVAGRGAATTADAVTASVPAQVKVGAAFALTALAGIVVWPLLAAAPEDAHEAALALELDRESEPQWTHGSRADSEVARSEAGRHSTSPPAAEGDAEESTEALAEQDAGGPERDSILHVVDARTGAPLDGVRVLPNQGSSDRSHPGPHFPASYCVEGEASPVVLPHARSIQSYWVTANGYTWSFTRIDHESGGEREVRLEPAGRLGVHAAGQDPELAIFLRVYPRGTRRVAASCPLDCSIAGDAFQGFDGLAAGEYDVRAEIGEPDDPPRVLAEALAVVPVGATETVLLEPLDRGIPAAVRVRGELVLPAGHEELDVTLHVQPAARPVLRKRDTKRISRESMNAGDGSSRGVLTWYAESLTPGRYLFVVSPVQYGVVLDVPLTSVDDLRIELPDLHPVVVRAIDAHTGEPVERAALRWAREMPPEVGHLEWTHLELEAGRGATTLLVPAGPFFLAASSPTHGQQFLDAHVGPGMQELTLELPRRIPLEIVLADGDTVIPWMRGMTCTFRRLGDEEFRPCGSFGQGKMQAWVDEPGLYEIAVGALDGFRQPEPVVVTVDDDAPSPVVVPVWR